MTKKDLKLVILVKKEEYEEEKEKKRQLELADARKNDNDEDGEEEEEEEELNENVNEDDNAANSQHAYANNSNKLQFYTAEEDSRVVELMDEFVISSGKDAKTPGFWASFEKYYNDKNEGYAQYLYRNRTSIRKRIHRMYKRMIDEGEMVSEDDENYIFYSKLKGLGTMVFSTSRKSRPSRRTDKDLEAYGEEQTLISGALSEPENESEQALLPVKASNNGANDSIHKPYGDLVLKIVHKYLGELHSDNVNDVVQKIVKDVEILIENAEPSGIVDVIENLTALVVNLRATLATYQNREEQEVSNHTDRSRSDDDDDESNQNALHEDSVAGSLLLSDGKRSKSKIRSKSSKKYKYKYKYKVKKA